MIYVTINDESFIYDVHSLIKAFYPAEDIRVIPDDQDGPKDMCPKFAVYAGSDLISVKECVSGGYSRSITISNGLYDDRPAYKSELKRQLYNALTEYTGHSLPWGTLTGIRPTKLAMNCLLHGADEAKAVSYMKDYYLCSDKKAHLATDIALRERRILHGIADNAAALATGYSLYIGIPFCPSRCMYCSFMSYPIATHTKAIAGYIEALKKEIDYVASAFGGRRLDSIYIGGGTPTTLSAAQLSGLIGYVIDRVDISTIREFTVEAGRADSIDREKLTVLKELGVDRISVNPQTFNEETLRLIGRKATASQTIEAYELAREAGFDNINMDIILGLPGEDMDDIRYTLRNVACLKPDDLTVHSLALKRGSRLAEILTESKDACDKLRNTDIDYETAMALTEETAASIGLKPYYLYRQKNISGNLENTGYAAAGREGIYNILMMEEVQDIVACGAGTVSKHVAIQPDGSALITRCDTHKDLKLYINDIDMMIERKKKMYA